MKHTFTIGLLLLAASGTAMAQDQAMNPSMHNMNGMQNMQGKQQPGQANTGIGRVNSVDMQQGKINMTHGPIKSLGWPGMTMDFKVRDKSLLEGLKPGEKVVFDVVKQGPGEYYIVRIVPK